jgi:7-carboxy-7-deazaguanine synthase
MPHMSYSVKEIYYTLQGEGANVGRPAVFCRFAGCNLWSGREEDRQSAICDFCDTDFVGTDGPGGGTFATAADLARAVSAAWGGAKGRDTNGLGADARREDAAFGGGTPGAGRGEPRLVVCTGGEPFLQLDEAAIGALHTAGFEVAVETNGTLEAPPGVDWICVSPKAGAPLVLRHGDELKLVHPQEGVRPEQYEDLAFDHFFLQPMDGPRLEENTKSAIAYCLAHPRWRLSVQTHKYIGID